MFKSGRGSPHGNPGIGGRPFQLSEGALDFNQNVFGDANAFIQQHARSGILGRGGFERAARVMASQVQAPIESERPLSEQPVHQPWPVWSYKPQSKVWVIET